MNPLNPSVPHPYQAVRLLGRGGMGEVWEVVHLRTQARYALKRVLQADSEEFLRLQREAEIMANLDTPHVVRVHSAGIHEGRPYLILELLTGGSLADRLRGGPLAPQEARRVLWEAAAGVSAAHQASVLHRDLKPDNLLFDEVGTVKVADFGLARRQGAPQERLTQTGEIMGTPSYMAPEQAMDSSRCDERADVYALGAILYACLTGSPPVPARGRTLLGHLAALQDEVPELPSRLQQGISPDLDALCMAALEKDPNRRIPTAAGFASRTLEGARPERRGTALVAVAALACLIAGSAVAWSWSRTQPGSSRATGARPTGSAVSSPTPAGVVPRSLSHAVDLQVGTRGSRETLACFGRGTEYWIQSGNELSVWDARSGLPLRPPQKLGVQSGWDAKVLLGLPTGRVFLASWSLNAVAWWPHESEMPRAQHLQSPITGAVDVRGGVILGDADGGLTFFDPAGVKGPRRPVFGIGGVEIPGRSSSVALELEAIVETAPDRLLVAGSNLVDGFPDGWILLLAVSPNAIQLLDSVEAPEAKSLAYDPKSGVFVAGSGAGWIGTGVVQLGAKPRLLGFRRNVYSLLDGQSTSFRRVALVSDHVIGLGRGATVTQNFLVSRHLATSELVRVSLPYQPNHLAISREARSALVCGASGLARVIPFSELGISE